MSARIAGLVAVKDRLPLGEAEALVEQVAERIKLARKAGAYLHECDAIVADMLGLPPGDYTEELLR